MKTQRLTINDHHDACVLICAVRQYCDQAADLHQTRLLEAIKEHGYQSPQAQDALKQRLKMTTCRDRTVQRLETILERFEQWMDVEDGEAYSGCPGDVGARDTF